MNPNPDDLTKERWLNDKNNWKAGIFYYNPADHRIFPPKRFGGGWTINFANPKSLLVFVAFIILAILTTWIFNQK